MNWSLMLSDMTGRTLGLIGLMATAVSVNVTSAHWAIDSDGFTISALISLFMFVMTTVFLIPSLHDQVLKRCMSIGPRIIFVISTAIWIVLLLAAIRQGLEPPRGLYAQYLPAWLAMYLMAALGILFIIFIFPIGLTFRSAHNFFVESGNVAQNAKTVKIPKGNLRKRDIWDFLVELPVAGVLIFPLLAMLFGNAVPTAGWDEWVTNNFWIALVVVGVFAILPGFLRTLLRPPHNKQRQMGTTTRVLALLVAAPLIAFLSLWMLRYHGIPLAWNFLTENTVETLDYEVVRFSDGRWTRDCIYFAPIHAPQSPRNELWSG